MPVYLLRPTRLSIVAMLTVMLALWFNVAVIDHQLDLHPEHHLQHDCQLFASAAHGLETAQWVLPCWHQQAPQARVERPIQRAQLLLSYFARSPPAA
ncbi:hypothetical protein VOA_003394 [Vibrio sp. RC586]|uniref:DUF2607 domain-containing protein n=1 Tax=Vibrio sp. RC586 TaxID=675815 RepID=UPI0001BB8680|nr:DUF2607 domain-containing protein [Vibrio sp. RC586]EEZ00944.1 hypothetical protein VOA_003394 [Vibrio sp. RC586]